MQDGEINKVSLLLKKFYNKKKKANPAYSMRALALDLQLDPSFVNRIFSGKKKFPLERLPSFIKVLDMDSLAVKELKLALISNFASDIGYEMESQDESPKVNFPQTSYLENFDELRPQKNNEGLFQQWFRLVLLDATSLPDFELNFNQLSHQLNVHPEDLEQAWNYLTQNQFISQNSEGKWVKSHDKIRIATKESMHNIRRFHKDMMSKAVETMYKNVDQKSFENRYITSATVTLNPEQMDKIRLRLQEMILEIVDISSQGISKDVYGMNFSFFPLLKNNH
jgi:uncharacterized protein (TIGR02147 family)